jgi:hypothetical protein
MVSRTRATLMSLVALGTATAVAATPAVSNAVAGSGPGVAVVTRGLDGPFGLQNARGTHRGFIVAENESGEVTRVFKNGAKHTILDGVPGVAGVAASSRRVFAVIGGPNEEGAPSGGSYGPSKVLRMNYRGGHVKVIADLMKYELKHNPDGQVQFVGGNPVDSLSNPFAMTWSRFGLFVADGGANDVLKINPRTGKVRTFFVPKTVKNVPACKGADANNNPGTKGCDPVPTGVQVLGNSVYVSTLGAERPGAGRIYKLNARTGKVQRVWKGFTSPTGVAVKKDGTLYFSQVLYGAPEGPPPPTFDPSTIGRITRIHNGHVKNAQVTMPTGLVLKDGRLYASAWSIASFFGMPHSGQVVKVKKRAFH